MAKPKKRKIKRKKGSKYMYFDAEVSASIQKFQGVESIEDRSKLYKDKIFPAFDKLVENLIFVYKFLTPYENYLTLKSDCVSFLYETLHKWDPSRGTKAFSYFNVVAKNWLIMNSRKSKRRTMRHVSIDDVDSMTSIDKHTVAMFDFCPPPDIILINKEFRNEIMKKLYKIEERVKGEKEIRCINAIIKVFQNIDNLELLNKRAVFVYVRDISGLNPKQLSVAMSCLRKHYREIIKNENK
ncbi:hypothetical protein CL614_03450 [archaeon]|nr:hypothetical protein [archaeon]